jgi:hypothetical protein
LNRLHRMAARKSKPRTSRGDPTRSTELGGSKALHRRHFAPPSPRLSHGLRCGGSHHLYVPQNAIPVVRMATHSRHAGFAFPHGVQ